MNKGKRGRLILTLESVTRHTLKQGLYELERFRYVFLSDEGERFSYFGNAYAILKIGKRFEVVATSDGFKYGATQLKRPRFQLAAPKEAGLF